MDADTIAAIATPPGVGAIAVLRVSGSDAFRVGATVFASKRRFDILKPRVASFGSIVDPDGQAIDEVLLTKFPNPNSYTGEDLVEISCHGGMLATQQILERLLEAGSRPAQGGEFTQRAFLNGKMDLTQAEAVMDVISAQTTLALRAANEQLQGRLGELAEELRQNLIDIIAHVEAFIDFPDEDIDPETGDELIGRLTVAIDLVTQLTNTAEQGKMLREGVRTVIAGAPNVGKSSLLNVLLGFDRAIVSETAGTTRDTIEEVINLQGIPLRLIDTAGFRTTESAIEREGISRAESQLANADLVLEVMDGSQIPPTDPRELNLNEQIRHLKILNKSDLGIHRNWSESDGIPVSCSNREGIDQLSQAILEALQVKGAAWGHHSIAINARHKSCLIRTRAFLVAASEKLIQGESSEFVAIELRSALESIGEMIGRTDGEEILDKIFGTFCIGK